MLSQLKRLLPLGLLLFSVSACKGTTVETVDSDTGTDTSESLEPSSPDPTEGETGEALGDTVIALAGDGIRVISSSSGKTQPIPFGLDVETSTGIVANVLGEPSETTTNDECGAGPINFTEFPNGFTMNAIDDEFVGWDVRQGTDSENMETVDGIGLGKTLAELEAGYSDVEVIDSTLGVEFSTGSLFGLLSENSPEGIITAFWAGTTCNFR